MVLFINPANPAPGVHTCPAPRPGGVMGKTLKNLLLRNHKTQSFLILCVAMYSGPLYKFCLKSCQPCPWGPYGPHPGGVMGKTLKNLLLRNHMVQSFHMLCGPMYNTLLYKCCQQYPYGFIQATPHVELYVNPVNLASGVKYGPTPGSL